MAFRESAVLMPMFCRDAIPYMVFTKRNATLRNHGGQFSFPGGARDSEDPTPLHVALRETEEELGIARDQVKVLGMLDELPTTSRFRVVPFVGVIPSSGQYRTSPEEIELVIEVPLGHLLRPGSSRSETWNVRGTSNLVYFYDFGDHLIWGATAKMLTSFLELIMVLPAVKQLATGLAPTRPPA
jgi:8-oxo-dGTP pyrophosphatase MutT (NUDIX family)